MHRRRAGKTVWLFLVFIFVEMFTMHVYPLLRESVPDASGSAHSVRAEETVPATESAQPVQDENDDPADHCCVCSCTHMLISEPARPAFFNEGSPTYAIRSVVFPREPSSVGSTPPPKIS